MNISVSMLIERFANFCDEADLSRLGLLTFFWKVLLSYRMDFGWLCLYFHDYV